MSLSISPESVTKTEVPFNHVGLVPEYECFDSCSKRMGLYINSRLRSLITTH